MALKRIIGLGLGRVGASDKIGYDPGLEILGGAPSIYSKYSSLGEGTPGSGLTGVRFANGGAIRGGNFRVYWDRDMLSIAPAGTHIIGIAAYLSTGTFYNDLVHLQNASGSSFGRLVYDSGPRKFVFYDANGAATAGTPTLSAGTSAWFYIEIKFTSGVVNSPVVVRVDGAEHINVASVVLNGSFGALWFTPSSTVNYADLYIADTTGTVNNDFLGDCRVEYLDPVAQGAHADWTNVGDATDLACVTSLDDDTEYLTAEALNTKESFTMSDLASTSGTVKGVAVQTIGRKMTSNPIKPKGLVRIGGADYETASPPNFAQSAHMAAQSIFDVNPATGVAWTMAEVNALEAGFKLSA